MLQQRRLVESLLQPSRRVGRSLKLNFPKFKPDEECPTQFIKSFNNICSINDYAEDNVKINALKTCFEEGSAPFQWYNLRMMKHPDADWSSWEAAFLKSYTSNPIQRYWNAVRCRYKGGSLADYFYEKQRKLALAFPDAPDLVIVLHIIVGLPEEMQNKLAEKKLKTVDELGEELMSLKAIEEKSYTTVRNRQNKPAKFTPQNETKAKAAVPTKQTNSKPNTKKKSNALAIESAKEDSTIACLGKNHPNCLK